MLHAGAIVGEVSGDSDNLRSTAYVDALRREVETNQCGRCSVGRSVRDRQVGWRAGGELRREARTVIDDITGCVFEIHPGELPSARFGTLRNLNVGLIYAIGRCA